MRWNTKEIETQRLYDRLFVILKKYYVTFDSRYMRGRPPARKPAVLATILDARFLHQNPGWPMKLWKLPYHHRGTKARQVKLFPFSSFSVNHLSLILPETIHGLTRTGLITSPTRSLAYSLHVPILSTYYQRKPHNVLSRIKQDSGLQHMDDNRGGERTRPKSHRQRRRHSFLSCKPGRTQLGNAQSTGRLHLHCSFELGLAPSVYV